MWTPLCPRMITVTSDVSTGKFVVNEPAYMCMYAFITCAMQTPQTLNTSVCVFFLEKQNSKPHHCPAVVTFHSGRNEVINGWANAEWGFRIFTLKMVFLHSRGSAHNTPMHTWAQPHRSMLFCAKSVSFLVSQRLSYIPQNECTLGCHAQAYTH